VELRVVNPAGEPAETDEVGEVRVRGANLMRGYLDAPEATAEVMRGGFLHTGDLGRLDAEGRLWLVDRLKDLILRGGYNVVPAEVEAALIRLPGVLGVAVVGRPDELLGEEIVAVFALEQGARLGPAEVGRFAQEELARPKQPREIAYVDALPLGPSRKVLRRVLRERLMRGELATQPIP
jgi:long-chain acyl-CoA synthetase